MHATPRQQLAPSAANAISTAIKNADSKKSHSASASSIGQQARNHAPGKSRCDSQLSEIHGNEEYGRTDLEGLIAFLDMLTTEHFRLTEVIYCVNRWKFLSLIPLKHHGFVLPCGRFGWLNLEFTSKGILWEVDDEFPEFPDNTFLAKSYKIDTDPITLKLYCQDTRPFDWHSNNCSSWAAGLLKVLRVHNSRGMKRTQTNADLLDLVANPNEVNSADKNSDSCRIAPCTRARQPCITFL